MKKRFPHIFYFPYLGSILILSLLLRCSPPPESTKDVPDLTNSEDTAKRETENPDPGVVTADPDPHPTQPTHPDDGDDFVEENPTPPPPITELNVLPGSKKKAELSIRTPGGLVKGDLAYSIPDSMKVGELSRASVLVSMKREASKDEMKVQVTKLASIDGSLEDSTKVVLESIRVGTQMKAKISDPHRSLEENFIITPLGDSIQSLAVDEDSSAFWQWDITPLKDGQFPINLQLEVKLEEGMRTIPVFTRTIFVESEPNWLVLAGGIGFGVVVLGLSLFFYRNRRTASGVRKREYLATKDIEVIRNHIKEGELHLAIDELGKRIQNLSPGLKNRLALQYQNFTEIQNLDNDGRETFEQFDLVSNRVSATLLDMVTDLEAHATKSTGGFPPS